MNPTGPLAGIKVLELGKLIAGPFCSRILAEFGAEVIKVESPGRRRPVAPVAQDARGHFAVVVRAGAQQEVGDVNLRTPEGQEIVRKLARDADIVVENFRPGALEKWDLGYDAAGERQPAADHGAALGLRADRAVPRPRRASA